MARSLVHNHESCMTGRSSRIIDDVPDEIRFPEQRINRFFRRPARRGYTSRGWTGLRMHVNGRLTALPRKEESDGHKLRSGILIQGSFSGPGTSGTSLDTKHFGTQPETRYPRLTVRARVCGLQNRKSEHPVSATHLLPASGGLVSRG